MEDRFLSIAKRLQAISSTGVFFSETEYDRERYLEIADLATEMFALIGERPINTIKDIFPEFGDGYATPKVDVRGAIIRGDEILLVKEKLDGLWTLPGGYADVGISAAENVEKEVWEESGLKVSATKLVGVFHKAKHEYNQDTRDFYKFYFLCSGDDSDAPVPGSETSDAQFFTLDELPPLSLGRNIRKHIELAFEHQANPGLQPLFD